MTTRAAFVASIRAAQPAARPLPEVPIFGPPAGDRKLRFERALASMGGACIDAEDLAAVNDWLTGRFGGDAIVASATPEIKGTRPIDPSTSPQSLHDVDVGVVRARFGVAETGSLWFSDQEYVVNTIGYLVQHLVVLLDPVEIVDGLEDAYRRRDFKTPRYAVLVTGPSATADIEGVMIRGAQGVRSLTVVMLRVPHLLLSKSPDVARSPKADICNAQAPGSFAPDVGHKEYLSSFPKVDRNRRLRWRQFR